MSFQADSMCLENCVWIYDHVNDSKGFNKGPSNRFFAILMF